MVRLRIAAAVLLLTSAVAGCAAGGVTPSTDSPTLLADASTGACASVTAPPTPSPTPPASATPSARGHIIAKAPIAGLIDLGQVSADKMREPPYNTLYFVCRRPGAISGIVVNDTWQDLQPAQGAKLNTATIDRALAQIRAYNAKSRHPLAVRLRIWAGIDAPAWAQAIGGPIVICDLDAIPASPVPTPSPCPGEAQRQIGAVWSSQYDAAWQNVQQQLAAKYDNDLLVSEVAVSSCSTLTSEPFVQPEDSYSKAAMFDGGYTDTKYQQCLARAIAHDYAPYWHNTRLAYSFNPFRRIQDVPPQSDLKFTERTIDACRAAVAARCVLLNETLAKFTPPPSPAPSATLSQAQDYYAMWAYMGAKGGEVTFQTASPPNLLDAWLSNLAGWNAAFQLAHRYGASSVEVFPPKNDAPCIDPPNRLWVSGYTCFVEKTLVGWKREITP